MKVERIRSMAVLNCIQVFKSNSRAMLILPCAAKFNPEPMRSIFTRLFDVDPYDSTEIPKVIISLDFWNNIIRIFID